MTSHLSTTIITKENTTSINENYNNNKGNSEISNLVSDQNLHYEKAMTPTYETTENNLFQNQTQPNDYETSAHFQTSKGFTNREMTLNSNNNLKMSSKSKGQFGTPRISYANIQTTSSHLNKENYRKEVMTICMNRKESFTHNNNNHFFKEKKLTKEYDSNMLYVKKTEKKTVDLRNELLESEREHCTFTPMLSSKSMKMIQRSKTYNSFSNCYDRNTNWKKRVNRRNCHVFTMSLSKYMDEWKFCPKTNNDIHQRVIDAMKNEKQDYVYQKNIKWLSEVNRKRKEASIEQIETMMNNQITNKNKNKSKCKDKEKSVNNNSKVNKPSYLKECCKHKLANILLSKEDKDKESLNKIKELKRLITDVNDIVLTNKKMIKEIDNSQYQHSKYSKNNIKTKQYYTYRYSTKKNNSYLNNTNNNRHASFNVKSNYDSNNSSIKIYMNSVSNKQKISLNKSDKGELDFKCKLLLQKYYKEKESINSTQ